jgi:hypothetical protein
MLVWKLQKGLLYRAIYKKGEITILKPDKGYSIREVDNGKV